MSIGDIYRRNRRAWTYRAKMWIGESDAEDVVQNVFVRALELEASNRRAHFRFLLRRFCWETAAARRKIEVGLPINLRDAIDLAEVYEQRIMAFRAALVLSRDELDAMLGDYERPPTGEFARRIRVGRRKAREALEAPSTHSPRGVHVSFVLPHTPQAREPRPTPRRREPRTMRELLEFAEYDA